MADDRVFHIPDDPAFLQAAARVSLTHAHLDYSLRMCIHTLANVSIEEALEATEYEGPAVLRDRVRKLARMRLGEGTALVKLQALLKRCEDATRDRNALLHNIIVADWLGEKLAMRGPDHSFGPLPAATELEELAARTTRLAVELNHARVNGWLAEALSPR
jgi:hypothetical protein